MRNTMCPKISPIFQLSKGVQIAPGAEVSRPVSRVVTLLTLTRACIGRTSSDAPQSLPFWRVFTSRSFMKYDKLRQTVRGIGRGAANTRASKGKKRNNTENRVGYSATLDAAGMAALNPRASGNGALLLDVSRRARGGARLCV